MAGIDIPYVVGYEAKTRRLNGFEDALSSSDFDTRYRRLVSGLDVQSVRCVDEIIRRLRLIFTAKDGDILDIYSEGEKKEMLRQRAELVGKTITLSNELYFWGGCFLPIKNFETSVFFYRYGLDKVRTLDTIGDAAIVDAGGYVGDSAWLFSPFTSGRVYVFEPLGKNMRCIRQTFAYNALENVDPIHAGLGAKKSKMTLCFSGSTGCATLSNKLVDDKIETEEIQVVALDEFVAERGIGRVGLIKTDVEGAEQMLLSGARQVIVRDRPILLISIYHNASDFFDIKPMLEGLGLGYEFKIHHPPIRNISGETVLIAEVPQHAPSGNANLKISERKQSAHEFAVSALWECCLKKDSDIASLREAQIQDRARHLEFKRAVAKRDGWLKEKTEQLAAAREGLAKRDGWLKEKAEQLAEAREGLAKRDGWLKEKTEQLAAAREGLVKRDGWLKEKMEALAEAREAVAKRDGWLKEKAEQLAEAREGLAKRDGWLKEKTEQLAAAREGLVKRDGWLKEKTERLAEAREAVAKRDGWLKDKAGQLAEAREAVAKRDGWLKEKADALAEAREAVAKRDGWLKEKTAKVSELSEIVRGREAELKGSLKRISSLESDAELRIQKIKQLESDLVHATAIQAQQQAMISDLSERPSTVAGCIRYIFKLMWDGIEKK